MRFVKWRSLEQTYHLHRRERALKKADIGLIGAILTLAAAFFFRPTSPFIQQMLGIFILLGVLLALFYYAEAKHHQSSSSTIEWEALAQLSPSFVTRLNDLTWADWKQLDHWFEMLDTDVRHHKKGLDASTLSAVILCDYLKQFRVDINHPLISTFQSWYEQDQFEGWRQLKEGLGTGYEGVLKQLEPEEQPLTVGAFIQQLQSEEN